MSGKDETILQARALSLLDTPPVIIAGAGLAALTCALSLAPKPTVVISPTALGHGAASDWAQGGIAVAIGSDDDPAIHFEDTLTAGAGLVAKDMAQKLTDGAADALTFLIEQGVVFDRNPKGDFSLGREGAHSRNRILHAGGDATGHAIMAVLVEAVRQASHITVLEHCKLSAIHSDEIGVSAVQVDNPEGNQVLACRNLVLATGGVGGLYARTTAPKEVCGEGHALAALIGAELIDMEFVQFHPTAMDFAAGHSDKATPLATEALRGQGALLINDRGERFMKGVHEDAELAPRDVVARTIFREMAKGRRVYLDCRQAIGPSFAETFPTVAKAAYEHGIDPSSDLLPVSPAAHYHMGGVATCERGRTNIPGLWACGEVACTGVHGANRLASNSLLEALVMGKTVAIDIATEEKSMPLASLPEPIERPSAPLEQERQLRSLMFKLVGLMRDESGLKEALRQIDMLRQGHVGTTLELKAISALMIAHAAFSRQESRGGHFRTDFPNTSLTTYRASFTLANTLMAVDGILEQDTNKQVLPA